jgi:hypothetical protein
VPLVPNAVLGNGFGRHQPPSTSNRVLHREPHSARVLSTLDKSCRACLDLAEVLTGSWRRGERPALSAAVRRVLENANFHSQRCASRNPAQKRRATARREPPLAEREDVCFSFKFASSEFHDDIAAECELRALGAGREGRQEQALKAELAKRGFESVSIKRELPGGRTQVEANKLYPVHVEAGESIYAPVPLSLSVELDARGRVKVDRWRHAESGCGDRGRALYQDPA